MAGGTGLAALARSRSSSSRNAAHPFNSTRSDDAELLQQPAPAAVQPDREGRRRAAEHRGGAAVVEPLPGDQADGFALQRGQAADGGQQFEAAADLVGGIGGDPADGGPVLAAATAR